MIVLPGIARLVDSLYAREQDETSWLEGIREAGMRAFEGALNCQVTTLHVLPGGRPSVAHMVGPAELTEHSMRLLEASSAEDFARLYFSGPLVRASQVVRQSKTAEVQRLFRGGQRTHGLADGLGIVGTDSDGACIVLAFSIASTRLPTTTRATLARLAGQLVTAHRLRRGVGQGVARFSSEGDAEPLADLETQEVGVLRKAALSLDRARRVAPSEPERVLGYWKALVEGKWTLVERFEADGRRVHVAYANEPSVAELRALTAGERKVVAFAALGHPLKLVAYELGFPESVTSELLSSGLSKLGLTSRADLIRIVSALGGVPALVSRERSRPAAIGTP